MNRSSRSATGQVEVVYHIGVITLGMELAGRLEARLEREGEFRTSRLKLPLEPSALEGLDALVIEDVFPELDALKVVESLPQPFPPTLILGDLDALRSKRLQAAGINAVLPQAALTLEQVLGRIIRERELERQNEQIERERLQGEQRLRLALESGRMGLWDWNTVRDSLEADDRTLELFDLTPESFDGDVNTLFAGIHPEDLPGVRQIVSDALRDELPYRSDYRVVLPAHGPPAHGSPAHEHDSSVQVRWIRSQGHPYKRVEQLCVVGFVEDISAEVKAKVDLERLHAERRTLLERRLENSEDRLAKLLNTLPVVVFALDAEGRFTLSEGQALSKLGLSPGEVVGQNALELYRDYPALTRVLETALGGQDVNVDLQIGESTFDNHYTGVRNPSGEIEGVFGIAFDVTENRRLEGERHAALERAELLAVLSDLLFVQSSSSGVFEAASEHLAAVLKLDYTCLMRPVDDHFKLSLTWGQMPAVALEASKQGFARSDGGLLWQAFETEAGVYVTQYLSTVGHLPLELPELALGVEPVRGSDGVVRATLSVGRHPWRGEWTPQERDLLFRVARTVGLALERTEREAALDEARAHAEVLAHLSDALQSAQTPDAVAWLAMERLNVVLSAQTLLFVQLEGDSLRPPLICGEVPVVLRPFITTSSIPRSSRPVLNRVLETCEALFLDDYASAPDALPNLYGIAAAMTPVCRPSGVVEGVLIVWRETRDGGWKSAERDLLRRTASTVGVALERAQFVKSLQERFDFVLESAGLGLWDWDLRSGVQHWSPEQEKLFGLEPGSFDGNYDAYRAHVHPDDLEETARRAEIQLDPSGPDEFEHEFRISHPAGVRWLYGRGRIERGEGGKALRISGVNFDITERKVQQQTLERTLERFNRAQSAARGWVFEWNLLSGSVERSSGVEEVLGYSSHELEKSLDGWLAIIHPDDLALGQQAVATALEQGGLYSAEYRVRHKAGHYLAVWERGEIQTDASGRPTLLVASTMDITQQRATLQALTESEEFASSVLESSPDCIKVLDLSGRILQMNNPGQKVMEIDDFESVRQCAWQSLWPLEMNETIQDAVLRAGSGQTVHFQGQSTTLKGTLKWWDVVVAPVRGVGGEVQRLVSVSRDMTPQREVFQTLVEREAELREAHDSQRRFVNDLAHELRTPLTAIGGNLELMLRYPQMTPQDRAEAVGEALSESQRLGRLATDLLALARGDAGVELEMSELELRPILLEVWRETGRFSKGHTLELGRLEALEVEGHRDRLKQLALILLDNALKYTPAPGRVALELVRDGNDALFKVTDEGPGIPEADLPRVFERFYRVRRPTQDRESDPGGTGLGLPIAQWIATQHGGSIWLESELGRGTTVFVRLPLLEGQLLENKPLGTPREL